MKTKIIILALALSLTPALANAKGKSHNSYKYFKHIRIAKTYRGNIRVINP